MCFNSDLKPSKYVQMNVQFQRVLTVSLYWIELKIKRFLCSEVKLSRANPPTVV